VAFLHVPLAFIILYAFSTDEKSFVFPLPGLTLKWFAVAWARQDIHSALSLSLQVAAIATLVAILLGTLAAAVESAAGLAGLEPDTYALDYLEQEPTFAERLLLSLTAKAVAGIGRVVDVPKWPAVVTQAVESTLAPLAFVERLNDPRGVYAYCFCDTR